MIRTASEAAKYEEYSKHNCVEISVYKDHISFINHNRPLPPVTIEDLNTKMEFKDRKYLNDELKEMFFKLDLIQSYGSGIRRAKNELIRIGSPALVFEPDNDTDDYTAVTAYINGEFAEVQREEANLKGAPAQEIAQETAQERYEELSDEEKIIVLIRNNPRITRNDLAVRLNISSDAVKRRLDKLKKSGRIEHRGSTKAGKWVVLK